MEKLERLINLTALLLDSKRPVTVEELGNTVYKDKKGSKATLKRMFERDKEKLREMGIAVEVRPGAGDAPAYYIPEESYYLPHLDLEPSESMALVMVSRLFLGSHTPFSGTAHNAILKLSFDSESGLWKGNLPSISLTGDSHQSRKVAAVYRGISRKKRLTFSYWSLGVRAEKKREVDPYALINRRGSWYLVGHCNLRNAVRWFKLDRIVGSVAANRRSPHTPDFDVPEGFDLGIESYWNGDEGEEKATAKVCFSPRIVWMAERGPWKVKSERKSREGWTEMELVVDEPEEFIRWVLGFGPEAEVMGPPRLREGMTEKLRAIADSHGSPPNG